MLGAITSFLFLKTLLLGMLLVRPASSKRLLPASGAVSERASTSGKRPRQSARTSTASRAGSSLTSGSSGAPSRGSAQKIEDRLQRLTRPLVVQRGLAPRLRGLVSSSAAPVTPLAFKTEKAEIGAGGNGRGFGPRTLKVGGSVMLGSFAWQNAGQEQPLRVLRVPT